MTDAVVVGLGRVGLPLAARLAATGWQVAGLDTDPAVAEAVAAGRVGTPEPGLAALVAEVVGQGRLTVGAPDAAPVWILCVPTPLRPDATADLGAVHQAVDAVLPALRPDDLLVIESTVPIGTTDALVGRIHRARAALAGHVHVACCPERVLPGRLLEELAHVGRLLGAATPGAGPRAAEVYRRVTDGPLTVVDARTAEAVKLVENTYRDATIALANELFDLCEAQGVDGRRALALADEHPRIAMPTPGIGAGGHCLPVDPWFLVQGAPGVAGLVPEARRRQDARPARTVEAVLAAAPQGTRIGCLGLTYKADVDDVRHAPALQVAQALAAARPGAVVAADPHAPTEVGPPRVTGAELIETCDVVVALVPHADFEPLVARLRPDQVVIDTCGWAR